MVETIKYKRETICLMFVLASALELIANLWLTIYINLKNRLDNSCIYIK